MPLLQHPDLEAHLADHPDDDASWLVFADWLQDRGDVRGEMIVTELRGKTAKALYREHAATLLAPLQEIDPRFGPEWPVSWRRGFPWKVQVGDEAVLARLAGSPLARFVQQLTASGPGTTIARFTNLRTVLIGRTPRAELEPFASLRHLERVSVSGNLCKHLSIDSPTLRRLEVVHADQPTGRWSLPAIEELRLALDWHTKAFGEGFVDWLAHPPPKLRVLEIQRPGPAHARALAGSALLAGLTKLTLSCCDRTSEVRKILEPRTAHLPSFSAKGD